MTYRYLMRYIGALAMLAGTALQGVQAQEIMHGNEKS